MKNIKSIFKQNINFILFNLMLLNKEINIFQISLVNLMLLVAYRYIAIHFTTIINPIFLVSIVIFNTLIVISDLFIECKKFILPYNLYPFSISKLFLLKNISIIVLYFSQIVLILLYLIFFGYTEKTIEVLMFAIFILPSLLVLINLFTLYKLKTNIQIGFLYSLLQAFILFIPISIYLIYKLMFFANIVFLLIYISITIAIIIKLINKSNSLIIIIQ